jgi:hypothetical protein
VTRPGRAAAPRGVKLYGKAIRDSGNIKYINKHGTDGEKKVKKLLPKAGDEADKVFLAQVPGAETRREPWSVRL